MLKYVFVAALVAVVPVSQAETLSPQTAPTHSGADVTSSSLLLAQAGDMSLPKRGQSMDQVKSQFGDPKQTRGPIGKPPITVWTYTDFTVYFEGQTVIHTVLHHKSAS